MRNHSIGDRGFTLIEVIIYVGLFGLLIGGFFVTAQQVLMYSAKAKASTAVQDEMNFVMGKINWALSSMETLTSTGTSLSLTQYDGTDIVISTCSTGVACIDENGVGDVPLTTNNVVVDNLSFTTIAASGTRPFGVTASLTLHGISNSTTFSASTTRYLRQ